MTVNVAGTVDLDGVTPDGTSPSGIFAESQYSGAGAGKGGNLSVNAGSLMLTDGAEISTTTFGTGNAGSITVDLTGPIALDGVSANDTVLGGIFASTSVSSSGKGGDITITAQSLSVTHGAAVSANTYGTGGGGNVGVWVTGAVTLDGAAPNGHTPSIIESITNDTDIGGGTGGDVTLHAGSLTLTNGANLSVISDGSGNAGSVTVNIMGPVTMSGVTPDGTSASGVVSSSDGSGMGGDVNVTSKSLTVSPGEAVAASAYSIGDAGSVSIDITGPVLLDGVTPNGLFQSTVTADTAFTGPGAGKGGDVIVTAQSLTVTHGAEVAASTFGAGDAGSVSVNVTGHIDLDGLTPNGNFSGGIYSDTKGTGNGGDISVTAQSLTVTHGAEVSAEEETSAHSFGSGKGGNVSVHTAEDVIVKNGGEITASAPHSNGGKIVINAGTSIQVLDNGLINAGALGTGGDITLRAGNLVYLLDSMVTGLAFGNGGVINITSHRVALNDSTIDGLSGGKPVFVKIDPNAIFIESADSQILTLDQSVPPPTDIAASLITLPSSSLASGTRLQDLCGMMSGGNTSSFIVTGQGGMPLNPGGWLPSFAPEPDNRARK